MKFDKGWEEIQLDKGWEDVQLDKGWEDVKLDKGWDDVKLNQGVSLGTGRVEVDFVLAIPLVYWRAPR